MQGLKPPNLMTPRVWPFLWPIKYLKTLHTLPSSWKHFHFSTIGKTNWSKQTLDLPLPKFCSIEFLIPITNVWSYCSYPCFWEHFHYLHQSLTLILSNLFLVKFLVPIITYDPTAYTNILRNASTLKINSLAY